MPRLVFIVMLFAFAVSPAVSRAQTGVETVLSEPVCSDIVNKSGRTVNGHVATARQMTNSGDMASFRQNFKLADGASQRVCSLGPFYEGQRLEFVLRSLVPLFSCKTRLGQDIVIESTVENNVNRLFASCL